MKASCQTLRTGLYACFSIHIAQILGHTLCFSSALSSFSLLLFPFFPLAQPQADAILSSLSILSLGCDHFLLPLPLILSPQSPLQYPTFSQVQHKSIQLHHFRLNANLSLGNVAHPSCIQLVQTAVHIPIPTMQVHTCSCCSHSYRHFPKAILRLLQMQHHIMPPKK